MQHITLISNLFLIRPTYFHFIKKLFLLLFFLQLYACSSTQHAAAQVTVGFDVFYNELSPFGRWVSHPQHGRIWYPAVHADFSPYGTDGYWAYTDAGWTWISDFSWGWAPFHYGRWLLDVNLGWGWVPDYEWSPGWVVWKRAIGFYGWAPIGPGIGIDFAFSSGYALPNNYWHFIREQDFGRNDIHNFYVHPNNYEGILHISSPIHNFHHNAFNHIKFSKGPERNEVERLAGRPLGDIFIQESIKPIQRLENNRLDLYRPQFNQPRLNRNNIAKPRVITPPRSILGKDKMIIPPPKRMNRPNNQKQFRPILPPKSKKENN